MLSSKIKKTLPFLVISSFVLSSCEAILDLRSALSQNVVWTSDDGRIEINLQGSDFEFGRAFIKVNGEDVVALAHFDDLFDNLTFQTAAHEENPKIIMELVVVSIVDGNKFLLEQNYNVSGDSSYDGYSTVLSNRPLKENELDAKYFNNGWVNKEHGLVFPDGKSSVLDTFKEGTFDEKSVYLKYLDNHRFTIEYQESSEIFASGSYVTHFDNMDLVFDEDCGRDVFGESVNMVWCNGIGEPLPPFEG